MLAERRKKARYVLNPIKKPLWTTDSRGIKFGKELMEKMGWSAGKGLGANEQGIQEPLRVFSKNDTQGIGYKKNEENWIEYQDEFNVLLNQLAGNTDNNAKTKEAEKSKVMSLEEKSKLSRARVHYHKFTRGKDISKYSENDLSCILGIGKIKKAKSETSLEKETSSENNLCETNFGVTTINSGSIKDYFKKKWTLNNLNVENASVQQFLSAEQQVSEKTNAVLQKKSKKKEKESGNKFLHIANGDEGNENKEIKKHRKKKKLNLEEVPRKKEENGCEIDIEVQKGEENTMGEGNSHENISSDCVFRSKEKKKKKREYKDLKEVELKYQSEVPIDEKVNNKRKRKESENSRNRYKEEVNGSVMEEELQNEILKEVLKKSMKKQKRAEESLNTNNNSEIEVSQGAAAEKLKNMTKVVSKTNTCKKKKLKMNAEFQDKDKNNFEEQWEDEKSKFENDIEEELVKKRKKKKRKEEIKNADENAVGEFRSEVNIGKEKKKKKKRVSEQSSEEQINGGSLEVELECETVEKKSVKKKKKYLKESKKEEEEELTNQKFSVEEVAVAAPLTENKQKRKSKVYAETESQPEEVRKKAAKNKKEKFENKVDQLQGNISKSQEKMSKAKKDKTKSEPHLDASGVALGIGNERSNNEKENKNEGDFISEAGETMIHTHKTALFHMKKPFLGGFKNCSTAKVLNLICGAEIERFKGANLGNIPGYGYKKKIEKNIER